MSIKLSLNNFQIDKFERKSKFKYNNNYIDIYKSKSKCPITSEEFEKNDIVFEVLTTVPPTWNTLQGVSSYFVLNRFSMEGVDKLENTLSELIEKSDINKISYHPLGGKSRNSIRIGNKNFSHERICPVCYKFINPEHDKEEEHTEVIITSKEFVIHYDCISRLYNVLLERKELEDELFIFKI